MAICAVSISYSPVLCHGHLKLQPLAPHTLPLPHTLPRAAAINLCRQPFQLVPSIYFLLLLFGEFSVFFFCVFCFLFLQLVNISLLCWRHTRQRRRRRCGQRRRSAAAAAGGGDIIREAVIVAHTPRCTFHAFYSFYSWRQCLRSSNNNNKNNNRMPQLTAQMLHAHTHTRRHTQSQASNKVVETKLTAFAFVPLAMHYPIIICMHAL